MTDTSEFSEMQVQIHLVLTLHLIGHHESFLGIGLCSYDNNNKTNEFAYSEIYSFLQTNPNWEAAHLASVPHLFFTFFFFVWLVGFWFCGCFFACLFLIRLATVF